MNAAELDELANHPDVHEAIAPRAVKLALGLLFEDPRNIIVGNKLGGVLLVYVAPGIYQWHYLMTTALSGRAKLALAREALRTAFTVYGAHAIHGSTPRDFRAARWFNRALGASPTGTSIDGAGRECIDYRLDQGTWASLATSSAA